MLNPAPSDLLIEKADRRRNLSYTPFSAKAATEIKADALIITRADADYSLSIQRWGRRLIAQWTARSVHQRNLFGASASMLQAA